MAAKIQLRCLPAVALIAAAGVLSAAPTPPASLSVAPLGTTAHVLRWVDSSADETGFVVERQTSPSAWVQVATLPANATTWTETGRPDGELPTYRVSALNGEGAAAGPEAQSVRMNVLFFLADDMGFKDIVANRNPATDGPTIYETPALDTLKAQAINFTQAYCSGPKCVVARRAIQTGMFDFRAAAVATGGGIGPEMVTVGEAMQSGGYRTGFIGKWHVGGTLETDLEPHQPPNYKTTTPEAQKVPAAQGYDVSIAAGEFGAPPIDPGTAYNPQTSGYFPTLIAGSSPAEYWYGLPDLYTDDPDAYLTDRLTTEATGFIAEHIAANPSQPFFLTLAHYAVHTPLQADPARVAYFEAKRTATDWSTHPAAATLGEFSEDYTSAVRNYQSNPIYAAMMDGFDDSLAAIRAYLAATDDPRNPGRKLAETTILVVSSDHGGKSTHAITSTDDEGIPTSNYPLRQGKTWVYEGGLRIPLMVYWPGIGAVNAETAALVNGADFYTTILDMTGTPRVPSQHLDSISFAESVVAPTVSARQENFHWFTNADNGTGNPALGAYRLGPYKMVYHMIRRITELYNLDEDESEANDLASLRPDLAADMLAKLLAKRDEVGAVPSKPGTNSWDTELLVLAPVLNLPSLPDGPPTALTATVVSDTVVDLKWTDGSTNEERFVIQRKLSGSGAFTEIATVPANTTRFRDSALTTGQAYQYRIQAETLAGWAAAPSNAVTVTPGGSVPVPIIARGDSVTLLKNEARLFHPLANDQGRALVLTAFTQPAKATAVLSGSSIQIIPQINASGTDQMTYTVQDSSGATATGVVSLNILEDHTVTPPPTYDLSPVKTAVDSWDFNDALNTPIKDCANSAGLLKFSSGTTPKTDGAGALAVVTTGTTSDTYRTAGSVSAGAQTLGAPGAGIFEMSVRFASANLSGGDTDGGYAGVSLRDKDTSKDLFGIRLQEVSGNLQLQLRNAGSVLIHTFAGATLPQPAEVRAEANLEARTVTVYYNLGAGEIVKGTYPMDPAAVTWNDYRLAAANNSTDFGPSDAINIDYFRIQSVVYPAPPSDFQVWMDTASLAAPAGDKLPGADPDQDGRENLLEFAMGTSPFSASGAKPEVISLAESGEDTELLYTLPVIAGTTFPEATTGPLASHVVDGIRYNIQGSLDLTAFNATVEEVFPAEEGGLPPPPQGWEYRTFRLTDWNATGANRGFLRSVIEPVNGQ